MKQRRRIYYSAAQRDEMWDRWQRGDSLHEIGRLFDRGHTSVYKVLAPTGGIRPPPRKRSRLALSLAEREEISRGLVAGRSIRAIAADLGRAPSTISREVARNAGVKLYRAAKADRHAWQSALRPKPCKLALDACSRGVLLARPRPFVCELASQRLGTSRNIWRFPGSPGLERDGRET